MALLPHSHSPYTHFLSLNTCLTKTGLVPSFNPKLHTPLPPQTILNSFPKEKAPSPSNTKLTIPLPECKITLLSNTNLTRKSLVADAPSAVAFPLTISTVHLPLAGATSAHGVTHPKGCSLYAFHRTEQLAEMGSRDTAGPWKEAGAWKGMVLGSVMATKREEYGLLPGRPEGEWVERPVICQGRRGEGMSWARTVAERARRRGVVCILVCVFVLVFRLMLLSVQEDLGEGEKRTAFVGGNGEFIQTSMTETRVFSFHFHIG